MTNPVPTSVRIAPELKSKLLARCGREGKSQSELIEKALFQYLGQPYVKGRNQFGLDAHYFSKKLHNILSVLDCVKPSEMAQLLGNLAEVCSRENGNCQGKTGRSPVFHGSSLQGSGAEGGRGHGSPSETCLDGQTQA